MSSPFLASSEGVRVTVRVQPGAARSGIDGVCRLANGATVLKVRISERAQQGKANAAVVELLAKSWKRPKRDLMLLAGKGSRQKTLLIAGDAADLLPALESWATELGREGDSG